MKLRILLAGFLAIAAGIAWWATSAGEHAPDLDKKGMPGTSGMSSTSSTAELQEVDGAADKSDPVADDAPDRPPPLNLDAAPPAWEQQLANILSAPTTDAAAKSRAVFAVLPTLPAEALATAAAAAVEILPDAGYASVALPAVTDARTHGSVMGVLFDDLLARPDAITLPTLLQIARNPDHEFALPARDDLKLLLHADFGDDWERWEREIQRALNNPKP